MKSILSLCMCLICICAESQNYYTSTYSDTWVATDALNRRIGDNGPYPLRRENKYVGVFYFIWMGAHGYDYHAGNPYGEIYKPTSNDINSPYDISEMLRENPENPQYGPEHAFHHWGQPHFNYYVSNDEWVIEKHIQMLADAGIDVMILDNTNAQLYLPQWLTICKVMTRMRAQGRTTPQLASIINSRPVETIQNLYDNFYAKGLYKELWFHWKGKPLVICPMEGISQECHDFFSIRHAWFDSREPWFDGSKDKWTWGDYYPQAYGWHESPEKAEQISVSAATHPTSNIGRSYHNGKQPAPSDVKSGKGAFFAEQWKRVFELDPEFVFITGWNEWIAMRFTNGAAGAMLGKPIQKGDTYFVDQYNEEFSRDIEPMRGGFGDNYYYQMVDLIRKYKGVNSPSIDTKYHTVKIDGEIHDWDQVKLLFTDDQGDITSRDHFGWGNAGRLTNHTGRNDLVKTKIATDGKTLYVYMEAADVIRLDNEVPIQLFLAVDHNPEGWEGFQYLANVTGKKARLCISQGGWNWKQQATLKSKVAGKYIEIAIPLKQLGITDPANFTVDFKWADNMPQTGDIKDFMDHGDTAPNARFRYRYQFKVKN